ncbi:MAG: Cyanophycin synthase [Parcubacteria bacterium C7867-004]|nr:MAG: Cyanophycin synthase [Parcubacteria bacterium C7867-004]
MKKPSKPYLGPLLTKIAPSIGATVSIEPVWGIVGQIAFKNGKKGYFKYNSLDLNTLGASEIAKDKDYANLFLAKAGYPTVPGKAFYSKELSAMVEMPYDLEAPYHYAQTLGFPVIVKPNSGSQGVDVRLVYMKSELNKALRAVFNRDRIALVQKYVSGRDYRIVVLDTEVMCAYERIPVSVTGDGKSALRILIDRKKRTLVRSGRKVSLDARDPAILQKLKRAGLTLDSVIAKDERVFLRDNANLSSGGDLEDVTKTIHPAFKRLAVSISREMGLKLCGVDMMVEGSITEAPGTYVVLEVNSSPGLAHYVSHGPAQEKIVENLYRKALSLMERI